MCLRLACPVKDTNDNSYFLLNRQDGKHIAYKNSITNDKFHASKNDSSCGINGLWKNKYWETFSKTAGTSFS
jgi:hypothetical protein